jgi:hypothetical protein
MERHHVDVCFKQVPDRGGRTEEMRPSAADLMPAWMARDGTSASSFRGGRGLLSCVCVWCRWCFYLLHVSWMQGEAVVVAAQQVHLWVPPSCFLRILPPDPAILPAQKCKAAGEAVVATAGVAVGPVGAVAAEVAGDHRIQGKIQRGKALGAQSSCVGATA